MLNQSKTTIWCIFMEVPYLISLNIIIYYFLCYLFKEGINSFIKSPFLIFYFIFILYFEVKFMCSIKYVTTKSSVRDALVLIYLFIVCLINLVPLIDYEKKRSKWIFQGFQQFWKHYHKYIYLFIYLFLPNFGSYMTPPSLRPPSFPFQIRSEPPLKVSINWCPSLLR
jgi:hypothetical protein